MDRTERIVAGALRVLNREPGASLARIAAESGISRATLHRHFATREDLLLAIGTRGVQRWEESQDAAGLTRAAEAGDPDVLAGTLHRLLRSYVADATEYGFALTDQFIAADPELYAWSARLSDRDTAFLTACQRAGVIRPDLPAAWLGNAVFGLMVAVTDSLRHGNVAPRDLPDLVVETFLKGARA